MSRPYIFALNNSEFKVELTSKDLKKIPETKDEIFDILINNHKYLVQSKVRIDIFMSFLEYWKNDIMPDIDIENVLEYYQLSNEFGLLKDYFTNSNFRPLFNLSILSSFDQKIIILDKSLVEKNISLQLDHYIEKYSENLSRISLVSLVNIFSNSERKLDDHEKAYHFIINNANSKNYELFILLQFLDGNKMNDDIITDSIINKDKHFGFIPKNSETKFYLNCEVQLKKALIENQELILENKHLKMELIEKQNKIDELEKQMNVSLKKISFKQRIANSFRQKFDSTTKWFSNHENQIYAIFLILKIALFVALIVALIVLPGIFIFNNFIQINKQIDFSNKIKLGWLAISYFLFFFCFYCFLFGLIGIIRMYYIDKANLFIVIIFFGGIAGLAVFLILFTILKINTPNDLIPPAILYLFDPER